MLKRRFAVLEVLGRLAQRHLVDRLLELLCDGDKNIDRLDLCLVLGGVRARRRSGERG